MRRLVGLLVLTALTAACSGTHHASPSRAPSTAAPATPRPAATTHLEATSGVRTYALKLQTPLVPPRQVVRVTLQIGNRGARTIAVSSCELPAIAVVEVNVRGPSPGPPATDRCARSDVHIRSGRSFTFGAETSAPSRPGTYRVVVTRSSSTALPGTLLAPLTLRVGPPSQADGSCTDSDLHVRGPVGMPPPTRVTRPVTWDLGSAFPVTVLPTDQIATVTAQQAWNRLRASDWIPISPLGRYRLLLGRVVMLGGDVDPAWLLVARHAPQARGLGLQGPPPATKVGPRSHDCFFTDGITGVRGVGNPDGLGIETGRLTTR